VSLFSITVTIFFMYVFMVDFTCEFLSLLASDCRAFFTAPLFFLKVNPPDNMDSILPLIKVKSQS